MGVSSSSVCVRARTNVNTGLGDTLEGASKSQESLAGLPLWHLGRQGALHQGHRARLNLPCSRLSFSSLPSVLALLTVTKDNFQKGTGRNVLVGISSQRRAHSSACSSSSPLSPTECQGIPGGYAGRSRLFCFLKFRGTLRPRLAEAEYCFPGFLRERQ